MKKFIIFIIFLILLLVGTSVFVSSNYFFNKYIAKNIKEYGFNYVHVDGALFKGFIVEDLSYKGKKLSSNVELKINPIKLITNTISIQKLHLIGVNKETLDSVILDFKPKDSNSTENSNTEIDINFEFNNILLTIKPFAIDDIKINRAIISVDYLKYYNGKFDIGELEYNSKSDIGDFSFSGKYEKRVLSIDSIDIEEFDANRVFKILNSLKSDENSSRDSELLNSPLTPKEIVVNSANITIKPFKVEKIDIKNLELSAKNIYFDVSKLQLKNSTLNLDYKSNDSNLNLNVEYKDKELKISKIDISLKKPNSLEDTIKKLLSNIKSDDNSSSNKIVEVDRVKILSGEIKAKNYKFKSETIKSAKVNFKNFNLDLNSIILLQSINLDLNSTNAKLKLSAAINKDIVINNLTINSKNVNNLINLIPKSSKKTEQNSSISIIPERLIVKKLQFNGNTISFEPYKIYKSKIRAKDIDISLKKSLINSGKLFASVDSNWGVAYLDGNIVKNNYYAKGNLKVTQELFKEYDLPLNANNLKKLNVDGRFGLDSLELKTTLVGDNILNNINSLNIVSSKNYVKYDYTTGNTIWNIDAKIETPYIKKANLVNSLKYIDDKLTYSGKIKPTSSIFSEQSLDKLVSNLVVNYKGNSNGLNVDFISDKLSGSLITKDYTNAKIEISNRQVINVNDYYKVDGVLKSSKISKFNIISNINFNKILPIKGNIEVASNTLNTKGEWSYSSSLNSNLDFTIPKNSILLKDIKNINYMQIKSFKAKLNIDDKIDINIQNPNVNANINYITSSNKIKCSIKVGQLNAKIDGNLDNFSVDLNTNSINSAIASINKIYKIDFKKSISGSIKTKLDVIKLSKVRFNINSPKVIYKNKSKKTEVNNISINGVYSNNNIKLTNYKFKYSDYSIFSTRESNINIDKSKLNLNSLWINDSLQVTGNYSLESLIGKLKLKSNRFTLDSDKANIVLAVDTNINLIKDKQDVSGVINILYGKIKSAVTRKNVAENRDIIILQRKREKESTDFAKNVKLNLKIKTKKPIIYAQNGSYFKLIPNIKIVKQYRSLSVFKGNIKVAKGSYYILSGKKLRVQKGLITFNGKSTSPNLNIELIYRGKEYTIHINVSGTPTRPILFFTSNPPLTKEQILAYLLFDDSSAVGTHSQASMLNMIGGSLAKSFLGSIGIKIDHISVKENGFSIGKNITKNVTVYYNQDREKASIKTRIDITNSIRTEIELGKDKQSADIIFTKEY